MHVDSLTCSATKLPRRRRDLKPKLTCHCPSALPVPQPDWSGYHFVWTSFPVIPYNFLFSYPCLSVPQSDWSDYLPLSALNRLLGPDWDIYLMTVLAVLLALVVFFRRPR